jgi:hypothetical protein
MGQPAAAAIGTSSKTDASCFNFNWICNCWYCNWCGRNVNYAGKNFKYCGRNYGFYL